MLPQEHISKLVSLVVLAWFYDSRFLREISIRQSGSPNWKPHFKMKVMVAYGIYAVHQIQSKHNRQYYPHPIIGEIDDQRSGESCPKSQSEYGELLVFIKMFKKTFKGQDNYFN